MTLALTDETKRVIGELENLDLDTEGLPDTIREQIEVLDEDEAKKAQKAWASQRVALRKARGVIQTLIQESEKTGGEPASRAPNNGSDAGGSGGTGIKSTALWASLVNQAMHETGINDPNDKIVEGVAMSILADNRSKIKKMSTAKADADRVFSSVMEEFSMLTEEDKEAVKSNLSHVDDLARTEVDVVRSIVHSYIGANFNKFSTGAGKGKSASSSPDVKLGASAISNVKARGGVAPGSSSPGGDGIPEVKPATVDERKQMSSIGLNPNVLKDVELFRKASFKKDNYNSHSI